MIFVWCAITLMIIFTALEYHLIAIGSKLATSRAANWIVFSPLPFFIQLFIGPEMSDVQKQLKLIIVMSISLTALALSIIAADININNWNRNWWNKPMLVANMVMGSTFAYISYGYPLFYLGVVD
jgi:hypothetical protein